jgi:dihydrofolate reductase
MENMKIIMMMAVTVDGKIAKNDSHFPDWTSTEDKKYFARISKECGVVIMGEKTFDTFPSPLKDRLSVVFTLNPERLEQENVKWVSGEPGSVVEELEKMGFQSAILGGGSGINTLFLKNKLIDEIILTVEPKIFGIGLSLFNEDFDINLELLEMEKLNENSIALKYKAIY